MSDGFAPTTPDEDDFPAMLESLAPRLDRRTIARVLGVRESELELIAIGHAPSPEAAERLRMLYTLSQRTEGDLRDPRTVLAALAPASSEGGLLVPLRMVPRLKTFLVAFVVVDALVVLAVFVVVAAR